MVDTVKARVDYWLDTLKPLGLGHWEISVAVVEQPQGSTSDSCRATITPAGYYDMAELQIREEFLRNSDDYEIDCVIVHELMHLVLRDFWDACMEPEYMFGKPAWNAHYNRLDHESEGVVDRTARALVAAHHKPWSEVLESEPTYPEHACPTQTTPSSN